MIIVKNLSKIYRVHGKNYHVLNDINFTVSPGEKLALMGRNGAGKSTLIRMLGKVEMPSNGQVIHNMSVSWPLGFHGAFQGSLTGIDNMRFIARIYKRDYKNLYSFVEDFSELGQHLLKPVKTYSSGMRARLAFALSIAIDFDCYLIDEVILVGDQRFHEKCMDHLFSTVRNKTMIIASHELGLLSSTCSRGLVLENGYSHPYENISDAIQAHSDNMQIS